MNTSILVSPLRYLETFYFVSQLSQWLYEELINSKYSDSKLVSSFQKKDFEIAESLIHLVNDRDILMNLLIPDKDCNIKPRLDSARFRRLCNEISLKNTLNSQYITKAQILLKQGIIIDDSYITWVSRINYPELMSLFQRNKVNS